MAPEADLSDPLATIAAGTCWAGLGMCHGALRAAVTESEDSSRSAHRKGRQPYWKTALGSGAFGLNMNYEIREPHGGASRVGLLPPR